MSCEKLDIKVKLPKICKIQSSRNNIPTTKVVEYFQVGVTAKFLYDMENEMTTKFIHLHQRAVLVATLVPSVTKEPSSIDTLDYFKDETE